MTKPKGSVLVLDRDRDAREALRDVLEVEGFATVAVGSAKEVANDRALTRPCVALLRVPQKPRTPLEMVRMAAKEVEYLDQAFALLGSDRAVACETISLAEYIERRRSHQRSVARTLRPLRSIRLSGPIARVRRA